MVFRRRRRSGPRSISNRPARPFGILWSRDKAITVHWLSIGQILFEGMSSRSSYYELWADLSQSCQSKAWKHHHKLECKVFASFMPKVLPPASRMIIQLVLRKQQGLVSDQDWARFLSLQHHLTFFREAPPEKGDYRRIQAGAMATKQYCSLTESPEQIETWFARLYINAQTLVNPIFHPLGQCLDPLPSTANHSCMPNAVVTFSGPQMTLRATTKITKGSEITISYIDPTPIAGVRQYELGEKYFFKCGCEACVNNWYCGQLDPPADFRRSKDSLSVLNSLAALDEAGLEAQEIVKQHDQGSEARYLALCQGLSLYLQQENIDCYPQGRQPFAWLRFEVTVELLSRGEFLPAVLLFLQTYYQADWIHFTLPDHPVRVVHAYTLSKLAHHIHYLDCTNNRIIEAMNVKFGLENDKWADVSYALLGEVAMNIKSSHGAHNPLTKQAQMEEMVAMQTVRGGKILKEQVPSEERGIRRGKDFKAVRVLAKGGWKWYRDWVHENVKVEKLDAGLQILIQPKQELTPTLLRPET